MGELLDIFQGRRKSQVHRGRPIFPRWFDGIANHSVFAVLAVHHQVNRVTRVHPQHTVYGLGIFFNRHRGTPGAVLGFQGVIDAPVGGVMHIAVLPGDVHGAVRGDGHIRVAVAF